MLAERLLGLTALAGRMVVVATATDEWEAARSGFAQLLGGGDPEQIRLTEQGLEETREQLIAAAGPDAGLIRTALARRWGGRLADLLQANPDAEAELHALVRELLAVSRAEQVAEHGREPGEPALGRPAGHRQDQHPPAAANHAVPVNGDGRTDAAGEPALEHPGALAARSELAYSTGQAGDAAAARDQFAALVSIAERVLGPEHPDTLAARASLAYWTAEAGDAAAARDQFAALVPIADRVLGPEHPDTLTNRHNYANFAGYAGDAATARNQFALLLPVCERVFGADSPEALVARFNLAYWTGRAGDPAGARDQFAALLPVRESVSGPDDSDTLAAREELAYWTGRAGDPAGARDQFAALLPVRERVRGPEHPETRAVWYQLAHWTALAENSAGAQG